MRKLMLFSLPFGAGTLLCLYLLPETWRAWTAAAALLVCLTAPSSTRRGRKAVRIGAAGLAAGILWLTGYTAVFLRPAEELAGRETVATFELAGCPEESGYGVRCAVRLSGMRGRGMLYGDAGLLGLEPGNLVTVEVKFYSAFSLGGEESFSHLSRGIFFRAYGKGELQAAQGRAGSVRYLPQRLAQLLRRSVRTVYDAPARGFLLALLTGERDGLDEQSRSDLAEAGLMHVTAVSGLHCGFLIALLGALVYRRQRLTALAAYPVLLLYMVMAGCTPSVVRACVMVGLSLLAPLLGREGDTPTSLSAALLLILLVNPFAAASVSLQLSFAAVAGLLLPAPRLYAALDACRPNLGRRGRRVWRFLLGTVSASLGVMLLTAPLSAAYFGALSLVSPLANLMVLWMLPVLFAFALVGTVLCALFPALSPLAYVTELMARYVLWTAGALAKLPGHSVRFSGPAAGMWLLLAYTMLGICALSRDRRRKYVFAAVLAAVCLAAMRALPVLAVKKERLVVVAVDVGQGAAVLLHAGDCTALVDCGSLNGADAAGSAVSDVVETCGWGKLDQVALTHYHEDHAGGLAALLARVEVDELLLPQLLDNEDQAALQREVLDLADRYGIRVSYVETPVRSALGEAVLTVLPPVAEGDVNEEGLTVLCTAGDFDVLITGDMNAAAERSLVETYALPDIEVLMVGHHGSKYSTSEELLSAASPEVGVISVGENSFGHPTQEAMDRMAAAGMTLYRTDWQGTVTICVH